MIKFIDGTPGSGKSYYAVDYAYHNHAKYYKIFTNINGFKFNTIKFKIKSFTTQATYCLKCQNYHCDLVKKTNWNVPQNIHPLNMDSILDIVQNCLDIYERAGYDIQHDADVIERDDLFLYYLESIDFIHKNPDYIAYQKELEYRKSLSFLKRFFLNYTKPLVQPFKYKTVLLIIDEAEDYFDKRTTNPLHMFLLKYHRHLYLDIFLLSQSHRDLNELYLKRCESFLAAVPTERQTRIGYRKYVKHTKVPYNDHPLYGTSTGHIFLKENQKIFSMYESGNKTNSKNVFVKYYFMFFGYIVVAFIAVYFLFRFIADGATASSSTPSPTVSQSKGTPTPSPSLSSLTLEDNSRYIVLDCVVGSCSNQQYNINIKLTDLPKLLELTKSTYMSSTHVTASRAYFYMLASPQFLQLFQGATNEKNDIRIGI